MPLIGKVLLIPLGLAAATSATYATIHKKMFESGRPSDLASLTTTLIISKSKDTIRAGEGAIATSQGWGTFRAGQDF